MCDPNVVMLLLVEEFILEGNWSFGGWELGGGCKHWTHDYLLSVQCPSSHAQSPASHWSLLPSLASDWLRGALVPTGQEPCNSSHSVSEPRRHKNPGSHDCSKINHVHNSLRSSIKAEEECGPRGCCVAWDDDHSCHPRLRRQKGVTAWHLPPSQESLAWPCPGSVSSHLPSFYAGCEHQQRWNTERSSGALIDGQWCRPNIVHCIVCSKGDTGRGED